MLKKILIGVAVFAVLAVAFLFYANNRNRTLSPPGKAEITSGDLTVTIPYSRPSVRGRVIFGTKEEGAIQPYGVYWRLGANESTEITLNRDVLFNGIPVKAGTYKIYTIPGGKDEFEIRLNSELGKWGAWEPDYSMDFLTTKVPVQQSANVEQHTISLESTDNGVNIIVEFSTVRFVIPLTRS